MVVVEGGSSTSADNSTPTYGTRIFGTTTTECTGFVIQKGD